MIGQQAGERDILLLRMIERPVEEKRFGKARGTRGFRIWAAISSSFSYSVSLSLNYARHVSPLSSSAAAASPSTCGL